MYHGIVINKAFINPLFLTSFKIFDKKQSGSWEIFGVEIEDKDLDNTILNIQKNTKKDEPWYSHLYNDTTLIVIFKDKVFYVLPHKSTWGSIIDYGKKINIPGQQLDFWPNRFQDENHYFEK